MRFLVETQSVQSAPEGGKLTLYPAVLISNGSTLHKQFYSRSRLYPLVGNTTGLCMSISAGVESRENMSDQAPASSRETFLSLNMLGAESRPHPPLPLPPLH